MVQATRGDIGEMVARARQGDREALAGVLATVTPSIHRFSLGMCRNVRDAEDVQQDTLINVANHLGDFEGRSSLSSWVFALTRSAWVRKRRGLKNRPAESDDRLAEAPDLGPTPEARAADQELASALSGAVDALSHDHREVILLRDVEGLSAHEAALSLGITVEALKSRLHRAREVLRMALRPLLEPCLRRPVGLARVEEPSESTPRVTSAERHSVLPGASSSTQKTPRNSPAWKPRASSLG